MLSKVKCVFGYHNWIFPLIKVTKNYRQCTVCNLIQTRPNGQWQDFVIDIEVKKEDT